MAKVDILGKVLRPMRGLYTAYYVSNMPTMFIGCVCSSRFVNDVFRNGVD